MGHDRIALAADILVWAEPLVRDRIAAYWGEVADDAGAARRLADLHWRAWRCALSALENGAVASRRELVRQVRSSGLPAQKIDEADEAVIDEIAEVIVARYRRSPSLAKQYTKTLVLTAASLIGGHRRAEAA